MHRLHALHYALWSMEFYAIFMRAIHPKTILLHNSLHIWILDIQCCHHLVRAIVNHKKVPNIWYSPSVTFFFVLDFGFGDYMTTRRNFHKVQVMIESHVLWVEACADRDCLANWQKLVFNEDVIVAIVTEMTKRQRKWKLKACEMVSGISTPQVVECLFQSFASWKWLYFVMLLIICL